MGRNEEGITMLNIVYYFNKDWITDDAKFELLTARTAIYLYLGYRQLLRIRYNEK